MEDLKSQQQSLEAEIAKIQQKKETERALLISELNSGNIGDTKNPENNLGLSIFIYFS